MAQWNVAFDDWFSTVTTQPDDPFDSNADVWAKMFGTSTYCNPNSNEPEDFEPTYLTPMKQELDDPMFDKHIEQDIAISNPLTQPHQTYSEIAQQQSTTNTRTSATPYTVDKVKSTNTNHRIAELSETHNQQDQSMNR